jgi:hypothetical protein
MPRPGDVHYLPVQEGDRTEPGKGDRPCVVLVDASATAEIVTVAYGSTKATEALWGAAHVLVDPFAMPHRRTGLSAPTYVYPSRVASYPPDAFAVRAGRLADELPAIHDSLRVALGLGSGVTGDPNVRGSNRRGRIARLGTRAAAYTGYDFALIVTDPEYSRHNRQQTIVPLLRAADYAPVENDVILTEGEELLELSRDFGAAIFAVPMVVTLFAPAWFEAYTTTVVSSGTMRRIEAGLSSYFGV